MRITGIVLVVAALAGSASGQTFVKHPKWLQVGPNPSAVLAVDLTEDGLPDILTADTGAMNDPRQERPANDEVSVLLAKGNLEYEALPRLRTGFAPYALAAGNVDAIRAPDVVVVSFLETNRRDVSLFRNMGKGLFEALYFAGPAEVLPYKRQLDADNEPVFTTPGLTSLVLQDFSGDGARDIIATGWCSDVLVYMPGVAETYFGKPQTILAAGGPRDIAAADIDSDGKADLAVALYSTHEVGLWKGDGKGGFDPATRIHSRGRLPNRVALADINGDKKLDVVVSHCSPDDSIVIFYGDGGFSFAVSQEILLGKERTVLEHEIRDLLVRDLNGDGRMDIGAACYGSRQVVVLINASESAAAPQAFRTETYTYDNARPRALCAADFNKDGAVDCAVALWEANAVSLLLGSAPKPAKPAARKP